MSLGFFVPAQVRADCIVVETPTFANVNNFEKLKKARKQEIKDRIISWQARERHHNEHF